MTTYQKRSIRTRLTAIVQQLSLPTHAPLAARNTVTVTVDVESGRARRESYCLTCRAADISGNHRRYGHNVTR